MTNKLEVTQEDQEAVNSFYDLSTRTMSGAELIRLERAFARHRLAAEARAFEAGARAGLDAGAMQAVKLGHFTCNAAIRAIEPASLKEVG